MKKFVLGVLILLALSACGEKQSVGENTGKVAREAVERVVS